MLAAATLHLATGLISAVFALYARVAGDKNTGYVEVFAGPRLISRQANAV
jgi:hypothetical protein